MFHHCFKAISSNDPGHCLSARRSEDREDVALVQQAPTNSDVFGLAIWGFAEKCPSQSVIRWPRWQKLAENLGRTRLVRRGRQHRGSHSAREEMTPGTLWFSKVGMDELGALRSLYRVVQANEWTISPVYTRSKFKFKFKWTSLYVDH